MAIFIYRRCILAGIRGEKPISARGMFKHDKSGAQRNAPGDSREEEVDMRVWEKHVRCCGGAERMGIQTCVGARWAGKWAKVRRGGFFFLSPTDSLVSTIAHCILHSRIRPYLFQAPIVETSAQHFRDDFTLTQVSLRLGGELSAVAPTFPFSALSPQFTDPFSLRYKNIGYKP